MNCGAEVWTVLSALGTVGTFIVAGFVFCFERQRQRKEKPKISIWVNLTTDGGEITLFNSGREALPIRKLDVPSEGTLIHSLFFGSASISGGTKLSVENFVIEVNKILLVRLHCQGGSPGHFQLRFLLFDGSFAFVSIDPSILGPYHMPLKKSELSSS